MLRLVSFVLFGLFLFCACGRRSQEELWREEAYCTVSEILAHLSTHDVDSWLGNLAEYDSLPKEYQTQLRDAVLQHWEKEQKEHGGVVKACIVGDTILDSIRIDVFIELHYADSMKERALLPMEKLCGRWLLK